MVPDDTVHLSHVFYQLILFIFDQFQIKRASFYLVFTTDVEFRTKIVVLFLKPIQQPTP